MWRKVMSKFELIMKALVDKQAEDIVVMDMEEVSPLFDMFVICSVSNVRLMQALKDNVEDAMEKHGYYVKAIEGNKESNWLLMDYSDIIIHIFDKEERNKYTLEKLWSDVPRIDISSYIE